jgi:transcription factor IIIB 90 kDa subunit
MKCPNCGSNNSIKDASRGDTICGDCGNVLEENEVVCDVAFENTKVVGSFVTDQK